MPTITVNDLTLAKQDVEHIAALATSTLPTATDRLGNTKRTMAGVETFFENTINEITQNTGYLPPVAYASGISITTATKTVEYNGTVYAPLVSQIPFTTSGTFETAKFKVIQGYSGFVTAAQYGKTGGNTIANLVGITPIADNLQYDCYSYYNGSLATASGPTGGGTFVWNANKPKSAHNGGTVISPTVPWNGAQATLANFLNGVGETLPSGNGCWIRIGNGPVSVTWFGTLFGADDTAAVQATVNSGAKSIYAPASTYLISTLDLRGKYIEIVGDGIDATIFKSNLSVTAMFNAAESSDVRVSPLVLRGMTLDGNGSGFATSVLSLRYRHFCNFKQVRFTGGAAQNILTKDTWLNRYEQCLTENSPIGMWLVGSNHRSKFDSMSFQGCTTWHIYAQQAGTAADGNDALEFSNCDVEYGSGAGVYLDVTSASFRSCYIGENISGYVFQVQNGNIEVDGGVLFYGYTTNSFGFVTNGGKTLVKKMKVSGQINPGFYYLIAGSQASSVRFEDCTAYTPVGGDQVMTGDFLDYGSQGNVYAERLGKNWVGEGNNVTFSSVVSGNQQTFTVLTAPGPTPLLGAKSTLVNNTKWRDGESAYIVVVYTSSQPCSLKLSATGFGGAPTKALGTLPATSGAVRTYIKLDQTLDAAAYTILELVQASSAVGDYITVMECFFADSRMLNKGAANFGNLYKC